MVDTRARDRLQGSARSPGDRARRHADVRVERSRREARRQRALARRAARRRAHGSRRATRRRSAQEHLDRRLDLRHPGRRDHGRPRPLLAYAMNGEPLPTEHGFPVRMVVPGLYGFVSATKWVVDLELTTFADFDAYWARRGWAQQAPIKTQSRIDVPKPLARSRAPDRSGSRRGLGAAPRHRGGRGPRSTKVRGGVPTCADERTDRYLASVVVDVGRDARQPQARGTRDGHGRQRPAGGACRTDTDGATGWHSVVVRRRLISRQRPPQEETPDVRFRTTQRLAAGLRLALALS